MAFASHHSYHHAGRSRRGEMGAAATSLLAKSAFMAVVVAAVILGLSGAASTPALVEQGARPAIKSDRLAAVGPKTATVSVVGEATRSGGAEIRRNSQGDVVYVSDPAQRLTSVARGATVPLSANSPLNGH
jgi:hypothetical protein